MNEENDNVIELYFSYGIDDAAKALIHKAKNFINSISEGNIVDDNIDSDNGYSYWVWFYNEPEKCLKYCRELVGEYWNEHGKAFADLAD